MYKRRQASSAEIWCIAWKWVALNKKSTPAKKLSSSPFLLIDLQMNNYMEKDVLFTD